MRNVYLTEQLDFLDKEIKMQVKATLNFCNS